MQFGVSRKQQSKVMLTIGTLWFHVVLQSKLPPTLWKAVIFADLYFRTSLILSYGFLWVPQDRHVFFIESCHRTPSWDRLQPLVSFGKKLMSLCIWPREHHVASLFWMRSSCAFEIFSEVQTFYFRDSLFEKSISMSKIEAYVFSYTVLSKSGP